MKKNYTTAALSVIFTCCEDVLTTSITKSVFALDGEDKAAFGELFK